MGRHPGWVEGVIGGRSYEDTAVLRVPADVGRGLTNHPRMSAPPPSGPGSAGHARTLSKESTRYEH